MKTTIDSAGRLVIPKNIRQEAGLKAGAELEIRLRDGNIEIEPAPLRVKLIRKGRLTVAVPFERIPPLTAEQVEQTRREIRAGRARKLHRSKDR